MNIFNVQMIVNKQKNYFTNDLVHTKDFTKEFFKNYKRFYLQRISFTKDKNTNDFASYMKSKDNYTKDF